MKSYNRTKKTLRSTLRLVLLIAFVMLWSSCGYTAQSDRLHAIWDELLGKYVNDGVVHYTAFKKDEDKLQNYLDILNQTEPDSLSPKAQLAFYMNSYNAYTVKLILDNFIDGKPVSSIKRLGGFFRGPWKIKFVKIGGKTYSLDNIEHDIIRPRFKEPRIHFGINCAAKSCPPLVSTAYKGETLDQQLEDNTVAFLNDKRFNYVDGSDLYVTKILSWFSADFAEGTVAFVKKYARGELKKKMEKQGEFLSVKYLDYDWSLNGE